MRNMNTMSSSAPAVNAEPFDFGAYGQTSAELGRNMFGAGANDVFNAPSAGQVDPFNFNDVPSTPQSYGGNAMNSFGDQFEYNAQTPDTQVNTRPPVSERLQARFGTVLHVGKRALSMANSGMLGSKMANRANQVSQAVEVGQAVAGGYETARVDMQAAWDNRAQLGAQAGNALKGAALETGKAGSRAALEYVMKHYGLEKRMDEATGEEKIRIAKKIKFGRRVVGTVLNPVGKGTRVATGAFREARRAAKDEALNQVANARTAAMNSAAQYTESAFTF